MARSSGGHPPAAPRRRTLRRVAALVVSSLCAWLIVCTWAFVLPTVDSPRRVDAIVVLGGRGGNAVIDAGIRLAREGVSGRVVLSTAFGGNTRPGRLCRTSVDIEVYCIDPDPTDTEGEAHAVAELAAANHWDAILVVTSTYHVTRARVIFERCVPGTVAMHGVDTAQDLAEWAYEYFYQSAAFLKVWASASC